jgi:hypothetical protein
MRAGVREDRAAPRVEELGELHHLHGHPGYKATFRSWLWVSGWLRSRPYNITGMLQDAPGCFDDCARVGGS